MIDPKEIESVQFETSMRGYSKKEVDHYLEELMEKVTGENERYDELERKLAAMKIQIEEIKSAADEDHAKYEKLCAEAQEELERARQTAEEIVSAAREEEKNITLRAKFEADKSVAAAKREAKLISEDAKQKANAVELASHRAADKIIGDAKQKAAGIRQSSEKKAEELILNAQASVEGERRLFMQLREEVISRSGEMSKLLTGQLSEIAEFAERVRRTSFGDIPADREELLERFAAAKENAMTGAASNADESAGTEAAKSAKDAETKPEAEAVVKSGRAVRRTAADGENDAGKAPAEASSVTKDNLGAEAAGDKAAVFTDTDSGEVSYSESISVMEDDDTYDYVGYVNGMSERAEVEAEKPTAEYDGLPQDAEDMTNSRFSRALTEEELDRIFSFDVEEIMKEDN